MSTSLLKQSLEIVESNLPKLNSDKKTKNKNPFNRSSTKESSPQPTTKKNGKIAKKNKNDKVNTRKQIGGGGKSAIQQAHERMKKSETNVEETLQKLLSYSSVKLSDATTKKIIRRAQNNKYILPEKKPEEESTSVFTEEDFAKFEREYFVG